MKIFFTFIAGLAAAFFALALALNNAPFPITLAAEIAALALMTWGLFQLANGE